MAQGHSSGVCGQWSVVSGRAGSQGTAQGNTAQLSPHQGLASLVCSYCTNSFPCLPSPPLFFFINQVEIILNHLFLPEGRGP